MKLKSAWAKLISDNPVPWKANKDFAEHPGIVSSITDAAGDKVFELETFTGDGDHINLQNPDQLVALVDLVNACSGL
jgi:hypothetical protein